MKNSEFTKKIETELEITETHRAGRPKDGRMEWQLVTPSTTF